MSLFKWTKSLQKKKHATTNQELFSLGFVFVAQMMSFVFVAD